MINDEQLAVLRTLVDSRRSLGEDHSRMGAQVYHLLFELVPGGAQRFLSAGQAKQILAGVRLRNAAGKVRLPRRRRAGRRLAALVRATAITCATCSISVRPGWSTKSVTSRQSVPDNKGHFASRNGAAPTDTSTRRPRIGHRLSRVGNRQTNRVLHIMATVVPG